MMISIPQMRAGRALLGWSQERLAEKASVSVPTIKRAETELGNRVSQVVLVAIRKALEAGGVEFVDGLSPGVQLRVVEVYANPRASDNVWGVVTRWEIGAPVQWVMPEIARKAADTAESRGDRRLANMLRGAAGEADRNNHDLVQIARRKSRRFGLVPND